MGDQLLSIFQKNLFGPTEDVNILYLGMISSQNFPFFQVDKHGPAGPDERHTNDNTSLLTLLN